ncbi:hypothetical protein [Nocardiopsis sp. YSL2]|uniref:hypothetical protein n=1 Tax=Nocardiopsis sp. YSL2 TaxID=2939492 RepID=UPI0026F42CE2|nr:hypothetical protein [Nocardiopsis sp. YSL2]
MGREVRRVPVDFDWPQGEVWKGFLMPEELKLPECPDCDYGKGYSTGYSPEAHAITDTFYPHQIVHAGAWLGAREHADRLAWCDKLGQAEVDNLVAQGRFRELRRREPTEENPRDWEWVSVPRTAEEVNAANRVGARTLGDNLHHDAINHKILVRFRCEQLGIRVECRTCGGEGDVGTPEQRAAHEEWERTGPPEGDGWQLWETVSEGSPISPVFPTADALAGWMSHPDRGRDWLPPPAAAKFVAAGWAPNGFFTPQTGLVSGTEYVGHHSEKESP